MDTSCSLQGGLELPLCLHIAALGFPQVFGAPSFISYPLAVFPSSGSSGAPGARHGVPVSCTSPGMLACRLASVCCWPGGLQPPPPGVQPHGSGSRVPLNPQKKALPRSCLFFFFPAQNGAVHQAGRQRQGSQGRASEGETALPLQTHRDKGK